MDEIGPGFKFRNDIFQYQDTNLKKKEKKIVKETTISIQ